jgi:hypothetical protein
MVAPNPRHYSMSEIKQKLLNPAQTSVFMVDVTGSDKLASFMSNRNFSRNIDGHLVNLSCCEASLPGSGLATHESTGDFSGVTEKMAYRRIYDDSIDLTFYVDSNYKVLDFLEGWFNYVVGEGSTFASEAYLNNNAYYRMNYPDNYKSNIFITKFEKINTIVQPSLSYTFLDAFPLNISSMPVSYESSELLKVTVSFAYTRYIRSNKLVRNGSYTGESTRESNATNRGIAFDPITQASFNSTGNPEFLNPQFGTDSSGLDFSMSIPPKTQGNLAGTPFEGQELIDAINANNKKRVEAGLPYVGRNVGPFAPYADLT